MSLQSRPFPHCATASSRMPDSRRHLGGWCSVVGALLLVASGTLYATAPGLQDRVLALDLATQRLLQQHAHPETRALTLYVGTRAQGLWLRRATVRIDEREPLRYEFSDIESRALQAGGLQGLQPQVVPAGSYRLRVELMAREQDARPDTAKVVATLDQVIEKAVPRQALLLQMERRGLGNRAIVAIGTASEDSAARHLAYLEDTGQNLAAAIAGMRLSLVSPAVAVGPTATTSYEQYNAGIAALREGRAPEGEALLERIGAGKLQASAAAESLSLRDAANLALGYHFLRTRQGMRAIPVLQRVRSPGPYGNRALLGLGWAHLVSSAADSAAPSFVGNLSQWLPGSSEDHPQARRAMPFRYSGAVAGSGGMTDALRLALVPWLDLTGRDVLDPAVQEATLAVPYVLAHLGAHEQAQQQRLRAIETLNNALTALDAAAAQLSTGQFERLLVNDAVGGGVRQGWRQWLADLRYDPQTEWLRYLIENDQFLDTLQQQRDLAALSMLLNEDIALLQGVDDAAADTLRQDMQSLLPTLANAQAQQRQQMTVIVESQLTQLRRQARRYLAEARYALARTHDRAPERVSALGALP